MSLEQDLIDDLPALMTCNLLCTIVMAHKWEEVAPTGEQSAVFTVYRCKECEMMLTLLAPTNAG